MKKFVIAVAILGIFVVYSLGIRHQSPTIGKPVALAASNAPTTTTTTTTPSSASSQYKDGSYTGSIEDAYYGNVQVSATISGGKITDVKFLKYPDTHNTSVIINQQAAPYLNQEAVKAQNSKVQIISGATFTSQAFIQSLATALSQAKA